MRDTALIVITLLSLLAASAEVMAQSTRDIISVRGGGRSVSGKVRGVTPDQIAVDTPDGPKVIPVEDIVRISLSDDPPGLGSIRAAVEAGQYKQAASQLERLKESPAREIVQQEIAYYRAVVPARQALQGVGKVTSAAAKLNAFLKRYPTSFRVHDAWELMGDLAASLAKFDSAATAYGKLAGAKSEATRARGLLLHGEALLRKGSTREALAKFQQAAQLSDERARAFATIGQAVCEALNGQPDKGVSMIQDVIADHDASDVELFAKAYNGLGQCYDQAGKYEDAVLAFLHTDLLFYRDFDAHAEALFYLGRLWGEINKPTDAAKARQLLKERYASTSWAKLQ